MWQHYRKTLLANQIFIAVTCIVLALVMRANLVTIVAVFVTMQVALVLGAAWSTRLRRRIAVRRESLPLSRRGL